jgi:hypothetical protein
MDLPSISKKLNISSAKNTDVSYDRADVKRQQNIAIVEAQMKVSVASGNEPMALLYKTALSAINEELEKTLGPNAIEKTYNSQLDVSPEATAERIVKGATGFFLAFKDQHSELSEEESLNKFMSVIGGGIDKGFEEARDILESLSVLEGEVKGNIDLTYEFVQTGLNQFIEQFSNKEKEE